MQEKNFSDEEKDILQEIMNIAFGKASADLAEVIDIYVVLTVPNIEVFDAEGLTRYIKSEIADYKVIDIIEQKFWGKFKGSALLAFPSESGKELVTLLDPDVRESEKITHIEDINLVEKESLLEIGNILIGACVGKLAELLGDVVTYSPPNIMVKNNPNDVVSESLFSTGTVAIVMKTVFDFESKNVSGHLFLTCSEESFKWLKETLKHFMEQYE